MAKIDWDISGVGGQSVVEDQDSMRCQLSGEKLMLWNGDSTLVDAEVLALVKLSSNAHSYVKGGFVLRSDASGLNCYRLKMYTHNNPKRAYLLERLVGGVVTNLGVLYSIQADWNQYVNIRFRVDGWQLSVEEYVLGAWNLVLLVEATDHHHASGYVGLFGESINSAYSIYFDNVEISKKII